eukprot:CAMPEP_0175232822 /NCGR_PEP_ID=MMETSP0093-20121207/26156_1 /TAXON_ID=311494 /ORGANISM="Alexandrium monilatum, Strain CCMP3105" /LENGTH=64 /DNA_ID=CAMNT_0016526689 /DNA_START=150 /DNA_END=340 /DNA_ORIENTATION=+
MTTKGQSVHKKLKFKMCQVEAGDVAIIITGGAPSMGCSFGRVVGYFALKGRRGKAVVDRGWWEG